MSQPDTTPPPAVWQLGHGRSLVLDQPRVIAIFNATPDSFYAHSRCDCQRALAVARAAIADGAGLLDIGGESTRPGAQRVAGHEQIRRVVPIIEAIRRDSDLAGVPISVDTTLAAVARAAIDAGADAINDVSAGTEDAGLLELAGRAGCGLVLMHRLVAPSRDRYSDQYAAQPEYGSLGVVESVRAFVGSRIEAALAAGVRREAIVVDPGLGFGKSVEQNLALIAQTARIAQLGYPVLSAASRKSFVGRVGLGRDSQPADRLGPSIAASLAHLHAGAMVFRVHDVAEQAAALRLAWAVRSAGRVGAGESIQLGAC